MRAATRSRASAAATLALVAATSLAAPARAAEGYALGDSIAADMAETIGMAGAAQQSTALRRNAVAAQFGLIPRGAVALMSLGLNDASDPVENMRKDIDAVIESVQQTGEKFVWIGPPCVLKGWDAQAKRMDDYLRRRLAETAIQYVSLRDPQICQRALRTGDGEHFTEAGYRYLWQKIRRDASYAADIELAPRTVVQSAALAKAKLQRVSLARAAAQAKPRKLKPRSRPRRRDDD